MDVGEDTSSRDGNVSQELVQFLVVADSKHDVAGNNTLFLVIPSSVSGKLKNLSSQVFQDGSKIDGSTSTNASSIATLPDLAVDTTDGELKSSASRSAVSLGASASFGSFASTTSFSLKVSIGEIGRLER